MAEDWSWFYGQPRAEVHAQRFGNTAVPPRQYLRGGGRRITGTASTGDSSILLILGALALLFLASRKK